MNVINIPRHVVEKAKYERYPLPRYRGNPFVEAMRLSTLTQGKNSKEALHAAIRRLPTPPGAALRRQSDFMRELELDTLCDVVHARPAYAKAIMMTLRTVLNVYVHRVPTTAEMVASRLDLITLDAKHILSDKHLNQSDRFIIGWRAAAGGFGIFGPTGSGKTTLVEAICRMLGKVILHSSYQGQELNMVQIPVLHMSVPHDATMRAFILQFAAIVDYHLGKPLYEPQVRSLTTIADAALLMIRICAAINLGALIVDDLQNLRVARGAGVDVALNLLALLIDFGTSVITVATPAVGELLKTRTRNTRKLISHGYVELGMMPPGSAESHNYQDDHWPYQYTSRRSPLTDPIREAWERAGAGNPAFSTLAYKLVQSHLIGGEDEKITPAIFEHVAHIDMAPLKPAIDALNSRDPKKLARFDDLIFTDELRELFEQIGLTQTPAADDNDPFCDEQSDAAPSGRRGRKTPSKPVLRAKDLPTENPLDLMALT